MKPLSAFVPDIVDDLHGVPDYLAEKHLVLAARKFCIETGLWRESIEVPLIAANQSELKLVSSTPAQSEIYCIYRIYLEGLEIPILNDMQLDASSDEASWSRYATRDHAAGLGTMNAVKMVARDKIKLIKTPDIPVESPMIVTATLIPTVTATELMDDLFEYHLDAMKAGAKYTLLFMSNQPWSDPQLSAHWRGEFDRAIEKESRFQSRRNTNRPMRARMRHFV